MATSFDLEVRILELQYGIESTENKMKALFIGKKEKQRLAELLACYKDELEECKTALEKKKKDSGSKKSTSKQPEGKSKPVATTNKKPVIHTGNNEPIVKAPKTNPSISLSDRNPVSIVGNNKSNGSDPKSPFAVDTEINSKAKEIEQILKKYDWYESWLDIDKPIEYISGLIFRWYNGLPQKIINGEDYSVEIKDGYIDRSEERGLLLWKVKEKGSGKEADIDRIKDREKILKILGISFTKSQRQEYDTFYDNRTLRVCYTLNLTIPSNNIAKVWSILSAIHLDRLLYHSNGWGEKMKNSEFARVLSNELFNYIIEFENTFDPRYKPLCFDLTYSLTNKFFSINWINWSENNYSYGITKRRYDNECAFDFNDMGYKDLSDEQVIAVKWIISMRVAAKLKEHGAAFVVCGGPCWLYPLSGGLPFFGFTVFYKNLKDNSVLKEW